MSDTLHPLLGFALIAGNLLLFRGYQLLVLDWHRQLLFELRNRLFDGVSHRDDAYRSVEGEINRAISSAHLVTNSFLIPFVFASLGGGLGVKLDPERRPTVRDEFLGRIAAELDRQMVAYIVMRAPLVVFAVVLAAVVGLRPRGGGMPLLPFEGVKYEVDRVRLASGRWAA